MADKEELVSLLPERNVGCFNPSRGPFRFILLVFTCLLTFGSYFCFDMPSVLQATFTESLHPNSTGNCTTVDGKPAELVNVNGTDCTSGLGLSETQFNLLYAIFAWTNVVVVVLAGILIDKLGNPIGLMLFSSMCLAGTTLFAIGLYYKGTSTMFPLFLLGRMIFGSGTGGLVIVQNRVSAIWFKGKELAFSFGCFLAISRLGSVLNFFLTESFHEKYGLWWTLWGGVFLCGVDVVCAIVISILDRIGLKKLQKKMEKTESKRMRLSDIKHLSSTFWLLTFCLMFFYVGVLPFMSNASKFIYVNYNAIFGFTKKESSYIAGSVYFVSMILAPILGFVVDKFGRRGILIFLCAIFTIPVYAILAFAPGVHPLVATIWLGFTYSIAAASLWPSFPLVVEEATIGTALGITCSFQMIGMGVTNIIVGNILDHIASVPNNWKYVVIYLMVNTMACVVFAVLVNINDRRKGGVLNQSPRKQDDA